MCPLFQCFEALRLLCTGQTICPLTSTPPMEEVIVSIHDLEVIEGDFPKKQLKMLLGWAAIRQDQLLENWELASNRQDLFAIDPLK